MVERGREAWLVSPGSRTAEGKFPKRCRTPSDIRVHERLWGDPRQ